MAVISKNLLQDYLKIDENFVLNIGNFDGIHWGHQAILKKTFDIAEKMKYKKAVITFSNKPTPLFRQNYLNTQIFSVKTKIFFLEELKVDFIFVFEFNSDLKNLTAEEFLKFLISNKFLKAVVIGENFTFGKDKSGNSKTLKEFLNKNNINVDIVPLLYDEGNLISSTMIRQHILSGDFSINKYLIEPFSISGLVEAGKHFGRLIQFPTANIYIYEQIRPKDGVYATITKYKIENQNSFCHDYSMTYIGAKGEIETHIFDRKINLYNKEIQVYFISHMRDNIKIESLSHLETVLKKDKEEIIRFFQDNSNKEIEAFDFIKRMKRGILNV